jgi:hypothetical protein
MLTFVKVYRTIKENGFTKTCCVTLVSDKPFYQGKGIEGIYNFQRKIYNLGRKNRVIKLKI